MHKTGADFILCILLFVYDYIYYDTLLGKVYTLSINVAITTRSCKIQNTLNYYVITYHNGR